MEQIRIYIPTGVSEHVEAIVEHMPKECEVELNDFTFEDGHREGKLILPNGTNYSMDLF